MPDSKSEGFNNPPEIFQEGYFIDFHINHIFVSYAQQQQQRL
jgi:hypothetical protein